MYKIIIALVCFCATAFADPLSLVMDATGGGGTNSWYYDIGPGGDFRIVASNGADTVLITASSSAACDFTCPGFNLPTGPSIANWLFSGLQINIDGYSGCGTAAECLFQGDHGYATLSELTPTVAVANLFSDNTMTMLWATATINYSVDITNQYQVVDPPGILRENYQQYTIGPPQDAIAASTPEPQISLILGCSLLIFASRGKRASA